MKHREDDLQKMVAQYLDLKKVLWCHVANERKTSKQSGKRLKDKGVKSGVPDVLIFEPKGDSNGFALELKIKPNKPTENQLRWLSRLRFKGWHVDIAYSFDEAKTKIDEYLR